MNLLIALVVVLAILAASQVFRLYSLSARISGKKEEDLDERTNSRLATYLMIFGVAIIVFLFVLISKYSSEFLPVSATKHGVEIDWLMKYNLYLVTAIFAIFNFLLFYFASKYRYKKGVSAFYYPHSNKLELIWTVIPAITMAVIIVAGLIIWNDITEESSEDALQIEIYAKQFDWTGRYAGADKKLGPSSFNFITGSNPLGVITNSTYEFSLNETEERIIGINDDVENKIMGNEALADLKKLGKSLHRKKVRILSFDKEDPNYKLGEDDVVTKELILPVGREIDFNIHSRDVLHSVFIPHFRLQMNAVPGMTTHFKFVPTITTEQMRADLNDPDFNYVLMCNKICGASHYNMQLNVTVVTEEEYEDWIAQQKTFGTAWKEFLESN